MTRQNKRPIRSIDQLRELIRQGATNEKLQDEGYVDQPDAELVKEGYELLPDPTFKQPRKDLMKRLKGK